MEGVEVVWLVGFALLALGGLAVVNGLHALHVDARRRRTWRAYPGEVVAGRVDGQPFRCQVGYRREDGTRALVWGRALPTTGGDLVGRAVQVLENPDDPHDAVVSGGTVGARAVGRVLSVAGSVAVVFGLVVVVTSLTR